VRVVGSALLGLLHENERLLREREHEIRERAGKRSVHLLVASEVGVEVSALLPDDFTFADYAAFDQLSAEAASRRLGQCATCPPYGGACASEYERDRGRKPTWTRENGLHFEWCDRWPEHLTREKLSRIGVGLRMVDCRLSTFVTKTELQKEARNACEKYASSFRRQNTRSNLLILGSAYGIGKTHLSIGVVAELIKNHKIRNAMFCYVPEFLERLRRSYDDPTERNLIANASRTDILVLDDLAAQRTTDWVREQLNLISNARWSNGLPTIITTNVDKAALEETLGPRSTSRWF